MGSGGDEVFHEALALGGAFLAPEHGRYDGREAEKHGIECEFGNFANAIGHMNNCA